MMDTSRKGCLNYILSTMNISLYTLFRIIFSCIHLLDGSCMYNYIHPFTSPCQTFKIANITYKETKLRVFVMRILLL